MINSSRGGVIGGEKGGGRVAMWGAGGGEGGVELVTQGKQSLSWCSRHTLYQPFIRVLYLTSYTVLFRWLCQGR